MGCPKNLGRLQTRDVLVCLEHHVLGEVFGIDRADKRVQAYCFRLRVTVDFPDAEALRLDYPHLDEAAVAEKEAKACAEIEAAFAAGTIALPMGMENGTPPRSW